MTIKGIKIINTKKAGNYIHVEIHTSDYFGLSLDAKLAIGRAFKGTWAGSSYKNDIATLLLKSY